MLFGGACEDAEISFRERMKVSVRLRLCFCGFDCAKVRKQGRFAQPAADWSAKSCANSFFLG